MITQGKWEMTKPNEHGECEIVTPDGHGGVDSYIAQICGGLGWVDSDNRYYESEANARLIAAAPALLAACKIGNSGAVWANRLLWNAGMLLKSYGEQIGREDISAMGRELQEKGEAEYKAIALAEGG